MRNWNTSVITNDDIIIPVVFRMSTQVVRSEVMWCAALDLINQLWEFHPLLGVV